jgi:hypothetical protein
LASQVVPQNTLEVAVCTGIMAASSIYWAYVIGASASFGSHRTAAT